MYTHQHCVYNGNTIVHAQIIARTPRHCLRAIALASEYVHVSAAFFKQRVCDQYKTELV
jgi:hypothetical protein